MEEWKMMEEDGEIKKAGRKEIIDMIIYAKNWIRK
jgi:hypothetical protein